MVAATSHKMKYTPTSEVLPKPSSYLPEATRTRGHLSLAEAEAAHKAEGKRLRKARLDQECCQKDVAERVEAVRQASLYHARHEELTHKKHEQGGAEAVATETFARQREAAAAHSLAVSRHIELLQHTTSVGIPVLSLISGTSDRSSLPPHIHSLTPPTFFGQHALTNSSVGTAGIGFAAPVKVAPRDGMPRPEDASQE